MRLFSSHTPHSESLNNRLPWLDKGWRIKDERLITLVCLFWMKEQGTKTYYTRIWGFIVMGAAWRPHLLEVETIQSFILYPLASAASGLLSYRNKEQGTRNKDLLPSYLSFQSLYYLVFYPLSFSERSERSFIFQRAVLRPTLFPTLFLLRA